MWVEIALWAWTGIALLWWTLSIIVVSRKPRPPLFNKDGESAPDFLSIFKPLPRMEDRANLEMTAQALLSFVRQLAAGSELLIGVHSGEESKWQPFFEQWRTEMPEADWKVIIPEDDRATECFPNRKISWQHVLAPHSRGNLWLWSDADITAPPGYVREALKEYQLAGAGLLTHSYVVRRVQSGPDLLNALFVNVEIYPGVRLMGAKGEIRFGLGAGLLFSRKDFEEKIAWKEVGSFLADDFYLGTHLPPVHLGSAILETFSGSARLRDSILHYLRWQKTIRWCNPLGFGSQIVILPMAGWLIMTLLSPFSSMAWTGLILTALAETVWVAILFRFTGCRPHPRFYALVPAWSVFRVLAFAACWFPWPVMWRSQAWWGPVRHKHPG